MLFLLPLLALLATPTIAAVASDRRRSRRSSDDEDADSSSSFDFKPGLKPDLFGAHKLTEFKPLDLSSFKLSSDDDDDDDRRPKRHTWQPIELKPLKLSSFKLTSEDDDARPSIVSDGGFYYRQWQEKQSRKREEESRLFELTIKHNQDIAIAPYRSYEHIGEADFKNATYRKASEWYQPPPLGPAPLPWSKPL
jgi:hypothetical protein